MSRYSARKVMDLDTPSLSVFLDDRNWSRAGIDELGTAAEKNSMRVR